MKVGDVVKFHTRSWVFDYRYENPGVVIEDVSGASTSRYRVLWANERMTVEHTCYLQLVEENESR